MGDISSAVTREELYNIVEYTNEILDNLPQSALKELMGGDENDLEGLVNDIMLATHNIFNNNNFTYNKFGGLELFEEHFDESLKKLSYNYFKTTTLPNFTQGWRNIEYGNLMQMYPWSAYLAQRGSGKSYEFCFALPLWRLYRYEKPKFLQRDTIDNKNSKDTVIITNESRLGRIHLEKIGAEIYNNEILRDKLLPKHGIGNDLGKEKIVTKNTAKIDLRTYGSFIRGLHIGTAIVDDFLDKSVLYSQEQRAKFKEVFYAEIMNIVEPGGNLFVSGTPFSTDDLYSDLKKDHKFKVFEYPGIYPDGRLLAPERFTFKELMDLRKTLGTLVFSREILVTPISDGSSIFPWDYLNMAFIGMENVNLVENVDSYPFKLQRIAMGCDFAISGQQGADYSVFSIWGVDTNNRYYLLHIWRKQGASHNEQVDKIMQLNYAFKPNVIVCENNGFQKIIIDLVRERGVRNVKEFTTTSKIKKDLYQGLPSLGALFERGDIKIPFSEGKTKDTALWLCGEFNSIAFNPDKGKLQSVSGTDDGVLSSFFAITELRENKFDLRISFA